MAPDPRCAEATGNPAASSLRSTPTVTPFGDLIPSRRRGRQRRRRISVAERVTVGVERKTRAHRVAGGLGNYDRHSRRPCLLTARRRLATIRNALVSPWWSRPSASRARHHSTCRSGWPNQVRSAERALGLKERHLVVAATADHQLAASAVSNGCLIRPVTHH